MNPLRKITIADVFTLFNGICGALAIYVIITMREHIIIASALILCGMIFDGLDGILARKFTEKHTWGRHLDSTADSITFCMAPAALIFTYISYENWGIVLLSIIAGCLTLLLGIKRLIKFSREAYKYKVFKGLPTPAMALFIVLLLNSTINIITSFMLIIVAAVLMVTPFEYPKLRGFFAYIFGACISIGLLIFVSSYFSIIPQSVVSVFSIISIYLLLILIFFYIFSSPFLMYVHKKKVGSA